MSAINSKKRKIDECSSDSEDVAAALAVSDDEVQPSAKRLKLNDQKNKDHEASIKTTQQENKAANKKGEVRCAKLPSRFDKTLVDKSWPKVHGYKVCCYLSIY